MAIGKQWKVSWKRVGIGLFLVFAILWLAARLIDRMEPWIEARRMQQEDPVIAAVPSRLPDSSSATLTGDDIQFFGVSMQTPWTWTQTIHSRVASGMAMSAFPEHHLVIATFEPNFGDDFEDKMFQNISGRQAQQVKLTRFNLMAAEMSATPADLKWWRSRSQNEAASFLLEMKDLKLGRAKVIYRIGGGSLRGFQEGDPQIAPYGVHLDLYDASDLHYQVGFEPVAGSRPDLTQAQINSMAAALRYVPQN